MLGENEKAFSIYRPDFFSKVQENLRRTARKDEIKAELGRARDGSSVLLIEKNGKCYRMNSAFRPFEEAERWTTQFDFDYLENIVVLFGLGNGILLKLC